MSTRVASAASLVTAAAMRPRSTSSSSTSSRTSAATAGSDGIRGDAITRSMSSRAASAGASGASSILFSSVGTMSRSSGPGLVHRCFGRSREPLQASAGSVRPTSGKPRAAARVLPGARFDSRRRGREAVGMTPDPAPSGPAATGEMTFRTPAATGRLTPFGGHVLGWQPAGVAFPVLYVSPRAVLDGSKPVRGGVPVCFPWFSNGPEGGLKPKHGPVRSGVWEVREQRNDGPRLPPPPRVSASPSKRRSARPSRSRSLSPAPRSRLRPSNSPCTPTSPFPTPPPSRSPASPEPAASTPSPARTRRRATSRSASPASTTASSPPVPARRPCTIPPPEAEAATASPAASSSPPPTCPPRSSGTPAPPKPPP